jgi:thiol-disulfide isomerase/thioredoxin
MWIEQQTHLLRRVREQYDLQHGGTSAHIDEITDYIAVVNLPVEEKSLQPPKLEDVTTRERTQSLWVGIRPSRGTTKLDTVVRDSPAARAGIRLGDEVVTVDGQPVASAEDIVARVQASKAGAKLPIVVRRDGKEITIEVVPEARPPPERLLGQALIDHPAPDVTVEKLDGTKIKLADLKGRVVVIEFWATWCGPCKITAPILDNLYRKYADIEVLGVSDEDAATIRTATGMDYTIARDIDDKAWSAFLVQALPTLVVIDKSGTIRWASVGAGDFDTLDAEIAKLRH